MRHCGRPAPPPGAAAQSQKPRLRHASPESSDVPPRFREWFARRGWEPRPHQLALLARAKAGRSTLLIAPTGAGKTLAGFLPSLAALDELGRSVRHAGLHTLYISPLKALAVDVARNLLTPIEEMGLSIRVETRTGDTPVSRRNRQRLRPPNILLTTPEQLTLLLSHDTAGYLFSDLKCVVLDELHAIAPSKRGDLLALDLARLRRLAPNHIAFGLSATVARPTELSAWIVPQIDPSHVATLADFVEAGGGPRPHIEILKTEADLPWASHTTRYATNEIYSAIRSAPAVVDLRQHADAGGAAVPGALARQRRQFADRAASRLAGSDAAAKGGSRHGGGALKAVVATSTLDLGIDWGDIDLVIHVGAPKGASRLLQRIGRANHRLDEPSKAILVPSNRFEVLECHAALEAAQSNAQDAVTNRRGSLDVLAQHVFGTACAGPFDPNDLFADVRSCTPYGHLSRAGFDRIIDFVSTGGYALRNYERFARLRPTGDGKLRLAHPRLIHRYRLNAGTIVESPLLKFALCDGAETRTASPESPERSTGGRVLGEIDEFFASEMTPGDTFVFGGEVLRLEGIRELDAYVSRANASDPKIPSYPGGKFPLSTHLAARVRAMLADNGAGVACQTPVAEWLTLQQNRSIVPAPTKCLVETFPYGNRHFLVTYPFEGRLAHQTLGMLLTKRLDRAKCRADRLCRHRLLAWRCGASAIYRR